MKTKVLITGATGNVGREVVNLFPDKTLLRAAVTDVEKARQQVGHDLDYVYFNFEDPATYESAFADVRAIFLMRPPAISNVRQFIAPAIETAKKAGVEHIVFLSLQGVERNHVVPHYKIEQAVLDSGLTWTFLRASFFMQNLNTVHRDEIKKRGEISVPVGKSKTSFIDVRDIAAVAVKALTENGHENRAYTLTGGEALDYYQVAAIMSSVLGRQIRYTNPSVIGFIRQNLASGSPLGFTLVMTALYTLTRLGMSDTVTAELTAVLNKPAITFQQYVEDYRDCWISA
jgi:uncharacterized protein YbjT (DUF2867 family)